MRPLPSELLPPPPCPDRPPPACSLSRPFVPAPNEEVGSHAGHGPPELNSRRGVPLPSPSPLSSPTAAVPARLFALERRGKEGD